jgi:hypothetical protein
MENSIGIGHTKELSQNELAEFSIGRAKLVVGYKNNG